MNTPEEILTVLKGHAARGMEKHPDFTSTAEAIAVINQYLGAARNASAVPTDPMSREQFALALARIGGLVLKTYANLDIPLVSVVPHTQESPAHEPAPTA